MVLSSRGGQPIDRRPSSQIGTIRVADLDPGHTPVGNDGAYTPSPQFLRETVHPDIREASATPIKQSSNPATVYRVRLFGDGPLKLSSVIVKHIRPDWPGDPCGHEREVRFYNTLLPRLRIPHGRIHYAGPQPFTDNQMVIMEDLSASHYFPSRSRAWSQGEIYAVLDSYARLHHHGRDCLPPAGEREWLFPRQEKRLWATATDLPRMADEIAAKGLWPPVTRFDSLLDATLSTMKKLVQEPPTLLHNDVYTPNLGLPKRPKDGAILLDWEMVGWGLAEMDLAFMFLQPFGSHRLVNRQQALEYYWRQREKLGMRLDSAVARAARQSYADALWALWLVPVAHQMALHPHPVGSAEEIYWRSMFQVVGEQLRTLSDAV